MSVLLDAEAEKPVLYPVWLLWMDVEGDPLFAHTGTGTITIGEGETGDAALDGNTFEGLGVFAALGDIQESENGSGPMQLTLPGVDPSLPGFKQLIADARRWQYRRAIVWFTYVNEDGTALVDYPQREKTGRLDGLRIRHDDGTCTISINIEGFASASGPPLHSKYADQPEIDAQDLGMSYVASLVNMKPEIGVGNTSSATRLSTGGAGRRTGTNLRISRY